MKKYILSLMMGLFVSVSSFAQSHSDRISVGAGALYQRGLDATISWEHETRYHNAWEYFINGYIKWDECASCGHPGKRDAAGLAGIGMQQNRG